MRVKYFIVDLFDISPTAYAKHLLLFSGELRTIAYAHVRSLMQPVIDATTAGNPAGPPPSKKTKNDVRAAKLKLVIRNSGVQLLR